MEGENNLSSFREEWNFMLRGKYIIKALLTPLILALVFGYLFSQNQLNESKIAVIDEDIHPEVAVLIAITGGT
ncbi:MAG: hypothetical protein K0S39_2472 [Paenibacillus sp.]|jgi:ABC-2 type transport system permease protein|nr:hypothetical protein [Paenibacillus sp.]